MRLPANEPMIYPHDFEIKLGFDQIRSKVKSNCLSSLGQKGVDQIVFTSDLKTIEVKLGQTEEFCSILEKSDPFPTSDYNDPEEIMPLLKLSDSYLDEEQLQTLLKSLITAKSIIHFFKKRQGEYPLLFSISETLDFPNSLIGQIQEILDDHGKIRDRASGELAKLRKRLKEEQIRARNLINKIFKDAKDNGFVPDGSISTIRDGRIVIPLKSEHRRKIKGFIHDESATGQTIFIEPYEVLELNNDIRDIELAERKEVIFILKGITKTLSENLHSLNEVFQLLSFMDCTRAKAMVGIELGCINPAVKNSPYLKWENARHPILLINFKNRDRVVPLNIELKEDEQILLVSGPNAGGKSVCLKTVGLIQYMLQCGLLIPLDESSTAGIFEGIFIDIGDQQSIENDLSTYSSHLRSMNEFVQKATHNTLVLIDEMGSGTDPNFGGGIAQAILKTLLNKQTWGVITTHYHNLKVFASENEGIRNAAMRFDTENMQPLYELEIGRPGNSFALEIARKIGLPERTIKEAEKIIGKDLVNLDSIIQNVMQSNQEVERKLIDTIKKEEQLDKSILRYEKLESELESKKKDIIQRAKNEASVLLQQTNKEIEKTIRHIHESKAEKKETLKVRAGLKKFKEKVKPKTQNMLLSSDPIQVGDHVLLVGQEVTGKVIAIKGATANVLFGDVRTTVEINQLFLSRDNTERSKSRTGGLNTHKRRASFSSTLDVRGRRAEEVIAVMSKYLDEAVLLAYSELKIIHGKGKGVLRKVVREQLKSNRLVESFKDEHIERGGDGATLVVLK